jgi:DNA polymerase III subunit delta
MVAIKGADLDAFLTRLDRARPVVLVYGPDAGLVSERVNAIIKASVDDPSDPFSLVRLESEEVAANPGRLIEEAQTIPLFGGRRAVWVKAGSRNIAPAVEELFTLPKSECRVVIEAGDLRRSAPLRTIVERAKNAAALPCYPDGEAALDRLIDAEMHAAGLSLRPEARDILKPLLGGDRIGSRNEIRKLALYAHGGGEVGVADVTAVVADASALAVDDLVDTAFAGRPPDLERELAKARTAGTPAGSIFYAAQRQLAQLHRWRSMIEGGERFSLDAVMPPGQFRRKPQVEAALKRWTAARLAAAMAELAAAVLASRKTPALADTIAEGALLSLAVEARRSAA